MNSPFSSIQHQGDFCLVGGGMTSLTAAFAAASNWAKAALMNRSIKS